MQWLYATAKVITFKTTLPGTSWGDWWWRLQRDCVFTPGPLYGLQVNFYSTWNTSSPSFTDCGVCRVVHLCISSLLSPRQGGGRGLGYLCLSFMWVLCVSAAKCSLWLGQSVWPIMSVSCLCVSVHLGYMLSCATAWTCKRESGRHVSQPGKRPWTLGWVSTTGQEQSWDRTARRGSRTLHFT